MEDIFIKNLPFIDLHGYDIESARVATNDFINDNIILRNKKILIIHGKGKGLVGPQYMKLFLKEKKYQGIILMD